MLETFGPPGAGGEERSSLPLSSPPVTRAELSGSGEAKGGTPYPSEALLTLGDFPAFENLSYNKTKDQKSS
jgi:hypothetical protein